MSLIENWTDAVLLKRTKFPPTQGVDDVMLKGGMKARERTHNFSSMSFTELAGVAAFSASFNSLGTKASE